LIDTAKADAGVEFFKRYLRHTNGKYAGCPFVPAEWQEHQILRPLYGTVNPATGFRRYRICFVELPRKNGKSEVGAGIAAKGLFADGEPGAQVYSAAADREQAANVYNVAEAMVQMNKHLRRRCKISSSRRNIAVPRTNSIYRVVSSDGRRQHGLNPSTVVFDEIHTQPNRKLWDAMTTGSDARDQALIFAITTYGDPEESELWSEYHDYARDVRRGLIEDPTFLSVHFGAEEGDDFDDPRVWAKANPALGNFLSLENFRASHARAKKIPSEWTEFLRYRLNLLIGASDQWIPQHDWDACGRRIDWKALRGEPCYAGLDLSTRSDLTALVLVFPRPGGERLVKTMAWLPSGASTDRMKPWIQKGLITETPGGAIDFSEIRKAVNQAQKEFKVRRLAYDPRFAEQLSQDLRADGVEAVEFTQNAQNYTAPCVEFETMVTERRIQHDGNPVLRWNVACTAVKRTSNGGMIPMKPDRKKTHKRIDCTVAMLMALDQDMRTRPKKSIFDDPAFFGN
jgi:phage terminase large subunit-like protein